MPEYFLALLHNKNGIISLDYTAKLSIESPTSLSIRQNLSAVDFPFNFFSSFKEYLNEAHHKKIQNINETFTNYKAGYGHIKVSEIKIHLAEEVILMLQYLMTKQFKDDMSGVRRNPYVEKVRDSLSNKNHASFLFLSDRSILKARETKFEDGKYFEPILKQLKSESDFNCQEIYTLQSLFIKTHHWVFNSKDKIEETIHNFSDHKYLKDHMTLRIFMSRLSDTLKVQFKQKLQLSLLNMTNAEFSFYKKVKYKFINTYRLTKVLKDAIDYINQGYTLSMVCRLSQLLIESRSFPVLKKIEFVPEFLKLEEALLNIETDLMQLPIDVVNKLESLESRPSILVSYEQCCNKACQLQIPSISPLSLQHNTIL